MVGTAAAQQTTDDTENATVDVTVSETTAVDIQPASLEYLSAEVGERSTSSERGFGAIEIENTGSTHINRIWLNTSVPSEDPFASGNSDLYDAGNFLEVRPDDNLFNGDTEDWHYINRKEYMYTGETGTDTGNVPSFIQVPSDFGKYSVAPLRRGNETIYAVIESDGGACSGDGSGTEIRVGNVSSTDTRLGTVDFTSDSTEYGFTNFTISTVDGSANYGIADTTEGGYFSGTQGVALNYSYTNSGSPLDYDMLTQCRSDAPSGESANTVLNRYNIGAEGADDIADIDGQITQYLIQETGGDESVMLAPGELATVETAINVPEGVAQGSVDPGTLRVLITSDPSAGT